MVLIGEEEEEEEHGGFGRISTAVKAVARFQTGTGLWDCPG